MNNKEINIIYGLYDPPELGGELRYIGQSAQGLKRAWHHKKPYGLKSKNYKCNWINSLLDKGLMYEAKVLLDLGTFDNDKLRDAKLNQEEIRLIAEYKALGVKLTNSTEGGEGTRGNILSEETKQIMSNKRKIFVKENGHHPSFLKLIEPKPKKFVQGVEHKHCSDCDKYKLLTEYHKHKAAADGLKAICKDCSNKRTKEYHESNKELLSEEQWQKSYDDRKQAMSEGLKARYAKDPEYRKKNSQAKSKAIIATNVNDFSITMEFPSALEAYKRAGYNNTYISQAIKSGKPYKGYLWKFKS